MLCRASFFAANTDHANEMVSSFLVYMRVRRLYHMPICRQSSINKAILHFMLRTFTPAPGVDAVPMAANTGTPQFQDSHKEIRQLISAANRIPGSPGVSGLMLVVQLYFAGAPTQKVIPKASPATKESCLRSQSKLSGTRTVLHTIHHRRCSSGVCQNGVIGFADVVIQHCSPYASPSPPVSLQYWTSKLPRCAHASSYGGRLHTHPH